MVSGEKKPEAKSFLTPIATIYKPNWKSLTFWRNSLVIYILFAWFGHVFELTCVGFLVLIGQAPVSSFNSINAQFVPADPYGIGALAIIWLVYPIMLKIKNQRPVTKLLVTYICGVVVCSIVELTCAFLIILAFGRNYFWDYSNQPFNLFGQVCLRNSLAFGAAAVLMVYILFPLLNNLVLRKFSEKRLNVIFLLLIVSYIIGQRRWIF